jgi:hypothetical protein
VGAFRVAEWRRGIVQTFAARIVLPKRFCHSIRTKENMMKKAILACATALASLCVMVPAHADDHHHPVCHKVKVHHHWEKRCH